MTNRAREEEERKRHSKFEPKREKEYRKGKLPTKNPVLPKKYGAG